MNPANITVGYDREEPGPNKHYAYFIHNTVEYGFGRGKTQEEAVTNLADQLAARLAAISDLVNTRTPHPAG